MWQTISDEKEKYGAYLASREWAEKKEAVAQRSHGWCERCRFSRVHAVHHLTYIRKYNEQLDDLQAVCRECHEFVHAKRDIVIRETGWRIYLAGKIQKNGWRDSVVHNIGGRNIVGNVADWSLYQNSISHRNEWGVRFLFDYAGPFFVSCDHGCCHGAGTHGYDISIEPMTLPEAYSTGHGQYDTRQFVLDSCEAAIRRCDILLAWIDDSTAFGTLVEFGMAHALGRIVCLGCPHDFDLEPFWFAVKCAGKAQRHASAKDFVSEMLRFHILTFSRELQHDIKEARINDAF